MHTDSGSCGNTKLTQKPHIKLYKKYCELDFIFIFQVTRPIQLAQVHTMCKSSDLLKINYVLTALLLEG